MCINRSFSDFITPGFISVWIGNYCNEDDFDDYLNDLFAAEFGFTIPPQAVREMGVEIEPVEIAKLVREFSYATTFGSEVVDAARANGIKKASCMFIIYNFKYDKANQTVSNPHVKFIGVLPYRGFS